MSGPDVVDEDVHQSQFVAESDERPQTGRVQRDAVRVLGELAIQLQRAASQPPPTTTIIGVNPLVSTVTGQLADYRQLADWTSRGLDNSRSRRCRQNGKLSTQSRRWHPRLVQYASCLVRELSSPRVDQSARCPVLESSSPRVRNPRVGVSASCPVTVSTASGHAQFLAVWCPPICGHPQNF